MSRIAIALISASCLLGFSASATAVPPPFTPACFKSLSDAQLQVWTNIYRATKDQCILDDGLSGGRIDPEKYSSLTAQNSLDVSNSIAQINNTLNSSLQKAGCQTFTLDQKGFVNGQFTFKNLCVLPTTCQQEECIPR